MSDVTTGVTFVSTIRALFVDDVTTTLSVVSGLPEFLCLIESHPYFEGWHRCCFVSDVTTRFSRLPHF